MYSFEDLKTLETTILPKIKNGILEFNHQTTELEFVYLVDDKELKEIRFTQAQPKLKYIDASRTELSAIVFSHPCQALETLYLHRTQLQKLELNENTPNLKLLDLNNNPNFTELSITTNLPKLSFLYLHKCNLSNLRPLAHYFAKKDFDFNVEGNESLEEPPQGIIKQGKSAIVNYFDLILKEQKLEEKPKYLFEVKMLVVGEGGTGKTSFIKKMKDINAELPKAEDTTKGVDIDVWDFDIDKGKFKERCKDLSQDKMIVNCWDFGGQDLYHGTHQIFFGEKSFYVLVADTREQKTDFGYWFNTIEQLAGDSAHVFVVINKKYGHTFHFDKSEYSKRYSFVQTIKVLSLQDEPHEIEQLQNMIKNRLQEMPQIGQQLSVFYVKIQENLIKERQNFIDFKRFKVICEENSISDYESIKNLSKYFHEIGTITHFIDDEILKHIVFLNSKWLVKTIYKVLDDEIIKNKEGRILRSDVNIIWEQENLQFEANALSQLMHNFGLMYKVKNKEEYVIPEHLPSSKPYSIWQHQDAHTAMKFRFGFDFYMPEGLISRLIVALHSYIENEIVWKKGVNLIYEENTFVEIIEVRSGKHYIQFEFSGKHIKEFLAVIRNRFLEIIEPFKKLVYWELIPCNCDTCKALSQQGKEIHYYDFKKLTRKLELGQTIESCDFEPYLSQNIEDLLRSVADDKSNISKRDFDNIDNQRIENIKQQISTQNKLLNEYEIDHMLEQDPIRRESKSRKIEKLKQEILDKKEELRKISQNEYHRPQIISLNDNKLYGEIPQKPENKGNSTEKTKEPKKKSYLFYFILVLVLIIVLVVALIFFPKIWEVIVAVSTVVAVILGVMKTVVEIKKETQSA